MNDQKPLPLRSFNPKVMLENISLMREMIQRIRQKEGGIGSETDEMCLHRAIHDLNLLVDMVDGLKAIYENLQGQADTLDASNVNLKNQLDGLREHYEGMIETRDDRIKELEKLGDEDTEEEVEHG
jgi:hypothetical protein